MSRMWRMAVAAGLAAGVAAWSASVGPSSATHAQEGYPAPRFPKYLRTVTTIEPLMPPARLAAAQVGGRTPLGLLKAGEHVLLVVPDRQDRLVLEAIKRALEERRVKVTTLFDYQAQGFTEKQAEDNRRAEQKWLTYGPDGWKELGTFQPKLRRFMTPEQRAAVTPPPLPHPRKSELVVVPAYVEKHPEITRVIYGIGGRAFQQRALGANAAKFLGNWTYVAQEDLLSKIPEFPGDVWKLQEEKILDAIPFVENIRATDPEGTDITFSVTEDEAVKWAKAAYLQGHIFLYPLQGSRGILEAAYEKQVFPDANGTLAGCSNHTAYFPCMKMKIEHGQITRIDGGGRFGDAARTLLKAETLQKAQWPTAPRPGYWYWFELALGTNPKYFRPIRELSEGGYGAVNMSERNRSGIIHLGLGIETLDPKAKAWCDANDLPCDHAWHLHNYFMTYEASLRDEDQKIKVMDKGRLVVLDDAEVRALASRYGDPDLVLREEWVPAIPGINVPGDYAKDYAPDPWKYIKSEFAQIQKGTYKYLLGDYKLATRR